MDSRDRRKFGDVNITGVVIFQSDEWHFASVEWPLDGEEVR